MKLKTRFKKTLSVLLAAALVSSLSVSALAAGSDITPSQEQTQTYTYQAPTKPMAVDDNIITASAHRAASPILGMLGVNATSGFGMINGTAPSDLAGAQSCAALGVWGSSLNANPDPYYWNYFYNFYAAENGLALSGDALLNTAAAASPVGADTTLVEEYGNVSISLYTRPDILVGCASTNSGTDVDGYNDQLATIHAFTPSSPYYQAGDETYSPKLVSYQTTTIKNMIWSVHQLADAIAEVAAETGKTTRYDDPQQIADDYESYIYGIVAYVQSQLAAKGLGEKTVAIVTAINEDGTYTIGDALSTSATSLLRAFEYSETVSKNLADTYGTVVTLDQLLRADAIITINNTNISKAALEESFGDQTYDGILITNTPATLYGLTMNSVENAMGFAYVIGCMYSDVLDIDPVELCAYFYQHFLHISDLTSLATVVKTNFANTILPEGVSATLPSTYSAAAVEAKLNAGKAYYESHRSQFTGTEYEKIGMEAWGGTAASTFTDVQTTSPYYEAILWAVEQSITQGTTATTFSPSAPCNRGQAVTFLWRAMGSPEPKLTTSPFTDVQDTSSPYYKAILWAVEQNITQGTTATTFSPYATVNRAQFFTFLWRCAGEPEASIANPFSDTAENAYYSDAVLWGYEQGLVQGTTATTFSPVNACSRGAAVTFLYRYLAD